VLKVELNRIDGTAALPALRAENVFVQDDVGMFGLREATDLDVEMYFPAPGGVVSTDWLELGKDVLTHLAGMDNEVQRSSAPGPASTAAATRVFCRISRWPARKRWCCATSGRA
jgi:hypothetical protein